MAQAQRALALWCLKFFPNWVRTIFSYGTLHSPSLLRHTKTSRFLSLDQVPCNSKTLICRWQAPANSLESTAPGRLPWEWRGAALSSVILLEYIGARNSGPLGQEQLELSFCSILFSTMELSSGMRPIWMKFWLQ